MAIGETMQLKSDFNDWYDYAFTKEGPVYERNFKTDRTRQQDLEFLKSIGCKIPRYGKVKDLVPELLGAKWNSFFETWNFKRNDRIKDIEEIVVYIDDCAHCGGGKQLVSLREAEEKYPDNFAIEYLCESLGESYRYLQVGNRKWWLFYKAYEDWRSNTGDGETTILCEEETGYHGDIKVPMFAVDFIPTSVAGFMAIDYNTAPGLDPLRDKVRAGVIVELLQQAMTDFGIIPSKE